MKRLLLLLPILLLSGCAMLPAQHGDLYDMQRDARAAYEGNENERAEKLLLGLVRAVPNDAETWFYLGNLYARTNRPDEAVDAYQKSLMLNRGDPRAWHNLGIVRLRQAWAAFIRTADLTHPGNPLHDKADTLIGAMEKMPLEGLKRPASPAAPAVPGESKK